MKMKNRVHFLSYEYLTKRYLGICAKTPCFSLENMLCFLLSIRANNHVKESLSYFEENFDVDIPEEYNFLEEYPNCDFGPITQECGCCYAYGPLKSLSHRICKITNQQILLSAQYIVACDTLDSGCDGGCSRTVFYFFEQHGITDNNCHPWKNILQYSTDYCSKCENGNESVLYRTKIGSTRQLVGVEAIKKEIYIHGPVAASVVTSKQFREYQGGIYESLPNDDWFGDRTHTVEIIGWGVENEIPYWIVLNQYGERWGENGIIRIRQGRDDARIESYVLAADPEIE